jgi:hypothetical protein
MILETAVERAYGPPLQGEGWVGMGFALLVSTHPVGKAALLVLGKSMPGNMPSNPIPTPALPLKGREQNPCVARERYGKLR